MNRFPSVLQRWEHNNRVIALDLRQNMAWSERAHPFQKLYRATGHETQAQT